jgi:tRNA(adenine34) deaminase
MKEKPEDHKRFMDEAFIEAQKAYERGEAPVGAVIVRNGITLARAGNRSLEINDPTAHAEILVLREAGKLLKRDNFPDCTVYTTLWPCPMCENALIQAKVGNVVCGARSFKYIYENTFNKLKLSKFGPIMEEECRGLFIKWLREIGRHDILEAEGL